MEQMGLVKQRELIPFTISEDTQPFKYFVSSGLLAVLKSEGAQGNLFTKKEIMSYLRLYICNRLLFDNDDPTLIHCENDPLGHALGVKRFTINEAMTLLSAKVRLATPPQKGNDTSFSSLRGIVFSEKRRTNVDFDIQPAVKWHRTGLVDAISSRITARSPIYIDIYESPDYDSSPESVFSCQGYETALIKDTTESSDDLWILETDDEYEIEADTFEVEYEVNSVGKSSDPEDDCDTDSESDVAEMVGAAAILVCQDDSDVEFWADSDSNGGGCGGGADEQSTSESDPEIADGDKWKCAGCLAFNRPFLRFCQKCWRLRSDWLPDCCRRRWSQREGRQKRRLRRRQRLSGQRPQLVRTLSAPNDGGAGRDEKAARSRRSVTDVSGNDECASDGDGGDDNDAGSVCSARSASTSLVGGDPVTRTTATATTDSSGLKSDGDGCCGNSNINSGSVSGSISGSGSGSGADGTSGDVSSSPPYSAVAAAAASSASLCSICLCRPKNASIVHGKIGHQTCCYTCGKKLWARNKPCPICRRTIQKVIQNYIV